jgi:molecular chaperone GrpE
MIKLSEDENLSDKNQIENEQIGTKEEATEAENANNADTVPTVEELAAKIAELEAAIKEKEDRYLRMAAEYDNFRRRSREEREAVYTDAVADTVGELLPIIDNLERAAMYDDGEKVKEGLAMTAKSVEAVFSKLKIEKVGAVGDIFDPNIHNAVLHGEDETKAEGEIVEVFQRGYKKGNKMIRFAMVKTVN